jgi:hypothetical protein
MTRTRIATPLVPSNGAARQGKSRRSGVCAVTLLLWAVLATAAGSAVASPYPLGESSVTPAPGSAIQVTPKGVPVSFTTPVPAQLFFAMAEISSQNALGPDGTLADERRVGFGLLFAHGSGGLRFSGMSQWTSTAPGTYYVQFSGTKVAGLSGRNAKCPGGEPTCLYASQVYSVTIPKPRRPSTRWIPARTRARSHLSARQARRIVRRAIRRETGRKPRNLVYRCGRKTRAAFVCESSWFDRKYFWTVRVTVGARGKHYVYSARGRRAPRSCLERTSMRRCATKVRWPTQRLPRATNPAAGGSR